MGRLPECGAHEPAADCGVTTIRRALVLCLAATSFAASCGSSSEGDAATSTTVVTTESSPTTPPTVPETTAVAATETTELAPAPTATVPSSSTPSTGAPATTTPAPRDPAKLYLPVAPTIGDMARQVVTSSNNTQLDAPGENDDVESRTMTELTIDREVTSIDIDSYVVTESVVDGSIELDGPDADPTTLELLRSAFGELTGTSVETTIGFDGVERSRVVIEGADLTEIANSIITTPTPAVDFGFDPNGIAVGDVWTANASGADLGAPIDIEYTLELLSFDGTSFEISISVDQDVSDLFLDASGANEADVRMTGSGMITGQTNNALLSSSTITIDMSGTIVSPDGETGAISLVTTTASTSTPR